MEELFSPWRLRYVTSGHRRARGCVFCHALRGRRDRKNLVLLRGRSNFVILNRYPYNNGHLMIVPVAHVPTLRDAGATTLREMMTLVVRCEAALRAIYHPTGINLGMNLGRSAGAGIEGHYHLHMVPRWDGDTNFMTVVHGTRVIPEALDVSYRRLRNLLLRDGQPGQAAAERPGSAGEHRRKGSRRRRRTSAGRWKG